MKINRNRLLSAMRLIVLMALASLFAVNNALTQSRGNADSQANGRLTIYGKVTELKYAYARQRDFPPPSPQGGIDLLMTNQPLTDEQAARIFEIKFDGSDKLRGLWMMFDREGKYLSERLLLQSGPILAPSGVFMKMMDGNQNTKVENGRI